jgi:Porin subfamily
MEMVKSVFLGSAAGLVAVTVGQAAELPVKTKPVQYVRVCSLYGVGFYYMPGTDMCIKIGGWARSEASWGINGNASTGLYASDYNNRYTNNLWSRERGYITADAREETAYGVARGYIAVGISSQNTGGEANSGTFSANRAFVQWAGFTAGQTESFFDFYPSAALMYRAGNLPQEDSGDAGWWVWAYTAQLGGGFSATLSAEERRDSQILNFSGAAGVLATVAAPATNGVLVGTSSGGSGYGGWQTPDIVATLRVDQPWGSAQMMGVLHEVNADYYGSLPSSGHPGDAWGWVAAGGIKINAPFVSPGDYFVGEVNYTQGATRYLWHGTSGGNVYDVNGAGEGWGVGSDCIFGGTPAAGNATSCRLTTAWGVDVGYEHYWTPEWHQTIVFNGMWERYGTGIGSANSMLCVGEGLGAGLGTTAVAAPGCNNNWAVWGVGSHLQWDVTKTFYVGVEAIYEHIDSAQTGLAGDALTPAITLANSGTTTWANQSNWSFTVRMHKDFLP